MRGYRITNRPSRFALLLLALLQSSCSRVRVTSPLSDPDKAKPDEQLCGVWKAVPSNKEANDSGNSFLFIGKIRQPGVPSGIMKVILIGMDSKNYLDGAFPSPFFTTVIGDSKYASLFEEDVLDQGKFPTWNKRNIKNFSLFKYKIKGDKLIVWWDKNDDAVEAAVRKGELKGTIEKKSGSKATITLTDGEDLSRPSLGGSLGPIGAGATITLTDGEDLSRLLARGGDKVFFLEKSKSVFSRVKK